ncbi:MAG: hypothetical protein AAGA85_16860 [Bacteroidota bacterium]
MSQVIGDLNVLDRDLAYFNYIPPNASTHDFDYQRVSGKISLPPIRTGKLSVYTMLGLDVHRFAYHLDTLDHSLSELEQFNNVNFSAFFQYKISDRWSVNGLAAPYLLSNFAERLSSDDLDFNGYVFLERTFVRKKGGYLLLDVGAGYLTLNGTTRINPIINLKGRWNKEWSFVLGLPNTYLKWDFHPNHSIKVLGDINDFSAHLSGSSSFGDVTNADRAVFTTIAAGLEYNYWVVPSLGFMFRATQPVWGDYELRDSDNDALLGFSSDFDQPFITVGIKFNPIRQLQNALDPQ